MMAEKQQTVKFERDGKTAVARSEADKVRLRFEGWREVKSGSKRTSTETTTTTK